MYEPMITFGIWITLFFGIDPLLSDRGPSLKVINHSECSTPRVGVLTAVGTPPTDAESSPCSSASLGAKLLHVELLTADLTSLYREASLGHVGLPCWCTESLSPT